MEWQDEIESKQRELQQLHAKRLRDLEARVQQREAELDGQVSTHEN